MAAGSIFRSITIFDPYSTFFAHIGQILNGVSGPFVISTVTAISSEWFPFHQRTLATSIAIGSSYAGMDIIQNISSKYIYCSRIIFKQEIFFVIHLCHMFVLRLFGKLHNINIYPYT